MSKQNLHTFSSACASAASAMMPSVTRHVFLLRRCFMRCPTEISSPRGATWPWRIVGRTCVRLCAQRVVTPSVMAVPSRPNTRAPNSFGKALGIAPDVSKLNVVSFFLSSMSSVCLFVFINAAQAFVISLLGVTENSGNLSGSVNVVSCSMNNSSLV